MKKFLATLLIASFTAILISGCGENSNGPAQTQTESPAPTPGQTQMQASAPLQQASPDTSGYIGEERAKEIALERAGITADGVRFDRVDLDRDNGVWQYEVDFQKDRTEYDVDIKADDGTVLSYETDYDD